VKNTVTHLVRDWLIGRYVCNSQPAKLQLSIFVPLDLTMKFSMRTNINTGIQVVFKYECHGSDLSGISFQKRTLLASTMTVDLEMSTNGSKPKTWRPSDV
jgi:hypothetical protein